jgi:two-component sensor histidine kinase
MPSLADAPPPAAPAAPSDDAARDVLDEQRDRAERLLNVLRAAVLLLLATAAVAYAPELTRPLVVVNVAVLAPMIAWTAAQYALFYGAGRLPGWLSVVNPLVDITAVTAIMAGYGLAESAALALKSPIFLAYFVILAGRPIASSARKAAAVAALTVVEYAALVVLCLHAGRSVTVASPLAASVGPGVAPLDEGAKLLLLAVAGAIAIYATAWHERLATAYDAAARERERMETKLAEAQLQAMRLQLHPHFLFNALNTITALISSDPPAAERTVSELSELLRLTLRDAREQEVPLERELEIVRHYVAIQQIRFRDRLRVSLSVDPDVRRALVPYLVLQPLIENAIRHGVGPRASAGRVEVVARHEGGVLHLVVADDGVGLAGGRVAPPREGVGLRNTRERLRHLYGPHHRFAARGGEGGGFTVHIEMPLRLAPPAAAAGESPPAAAAGGAERVMEVVS